MSKGFEIVPFISGGTISEDLLYVEKNILSLSNCQDHTSYSSKDIKPSMICAGEAGKDACQVSRYLKRTEHIIFLRSL